jgi:hypothetical protein
VFGSFFGGVNYASDLNDTRCQFHQHFTSSLFFIRKNTAQLFSIEKGYFEYGSFKNTNFDTNLTLKISRLVSSKTSDCNFEFIIKNVNFKNTVRNYVDNLSIKLSHE